MLFTSLLAAAAAVWVRRSLEADRVLQRSWTWLAIGLSVWTLGVCCAPCCMLCRLPRTRSLSRWKRFYLLGSLPLWVGLAVYPRKQRQTFWPPGITL